MSTFIADAVPLADVAKRMKTTVAQLEDECRQINVFIGVDWADQPAIAAADAHGLVTGEARRIHAHAVAWNRYSLDAEAWTRRRDEAVQIAAGIASRAATLAFEGPGDAQRKGVEAGREAGRKFEEENPAPVWEDGQQPLTERRFSDPSLFRRVLDRVVGGAA
jgi:hypothetical protein